jgi:hypothetical protein
MLPKQFYWAFLLLVCGYAFWRGRADERVAATVALAATVATHFAISPDRIRYSGEETGVMLVDLITFAAFTLIALRSSRFWPLWVAGLQLTTTMAHLLKAVHVELLPKAYAAALVFWSYPILIILAVGTWRSHQRRLREPMGMVATQ